jgi:hypothetical protein
MSINYGLLRRLRTTLYNLKRAYGGSFHIYTLIDSSTNYSTGVKTATQAVTNIQRGIVLPVLLRKELVLTGALPSSGKTVSFGSYYDAGTKLFVIDAQDVPSTFTVDLDDWLVFDGKKFNFKSIEELDNGAGWLITGVAVEREVGILPHQDLFHDLILTSVLTEVLN